MLTLFEWKIGIRKEFTLNIKPFLGENFLLGNTFACKLFHQYASKMPIFDYHNHLSAKEIFDRRKYANITELWLECDHYKWRAMRAVGIDEHFITGNATDFEKFEKWAYTVQRIPLNPLYHWVHLELQRYFDIDTPLCSQTAQEIWRACNAKLSGENYSALGLLEKMQVKALCTTDEPFDNLQWHTKLQQDKNCSVQVLPTFRPDALIHIDNDNFLSGVKALEKSENTRISSLEQLKAALVSSIMRFKQAGCLVADLGFLRFEYARLGNAANIFEKALKGQSLSPSQAVEYKGEIMRFFASQFAKNGLVMQLHMGTLRNNNKNMLQKLGVNTGYDSVGETTNPVLLSSFLDDLEMQSALPKTILYCLNPNDNTMLATMALNFAKAGTGGYVQFGASWWFQDHVRGIKNQLDELFETGLISVFIGMLTDSRSFTSFTRHEYFRRILCNKLGEAVEAGEYPPDFEMLGQMVQDICFNNAVQYFGLRGK